MEEGTSGSRRTRSQVAPDWTVKDSLILVNEIAAVEADCSNAFSSFQKWKIISENCNALDVHRTLNQCRRKWDALLSDYNQIKQWQAQTRGGGSYWSLSTERRKKLKLPENFDNQLFEVVDAVLTVQEDKAGTEPDSDPEAQADADAPDVIAELGPKRSRRWVVAAKKNPPRKTGKERKTQTNQTQEKAKQQLPEAKIHHKLVEEKFLLESSTDEEVTVNMEEEAEAMAMRLGEKADMIHDIVAGSLSDDGETKDDSNGLKIESVRRQGDQLIACLGEIVDTLNKYREFTQEF